MQALLNQIGDRNPQLFRELKGRLTRRNLLVTLVTTLIGQFLLVQALWQEGPEPVFRVLNWLMPCLLLIPGSWLLVTDLEQEDRRGTLNFIRLSPQTSYSILLGKLLGVPILVYLGVGMTIPLHLWSAIALSAPIGFLVSFYGLLGVAGCLVFSLAMLCGFSSKAIAGLNNNTVGSGLGLLFVLLVWCGFFPAYMVWNKGTVWNFFGSYLTGSWDTANWQWFCLPISQNPLIAHGFTLANASLGIYWTWQALSRSFHNPTATLFSKRLSFGLVAYCNLFMLGFFVQSPAVLNSNDDYLGALAVLATLNLLLFLPLIATLLPHRQALLDWARYRRDRQTHTQQSRWASRVQDLIHDEKSPALLAIALNLGIVAVILGTWVLLWPADTQQFLALAGLALMLSLMAIYAATAQLAFLMKTPQRAVWATALLLVLPFLPPTLLLLLNRGEAIGAHPLLLFSPFLWMALPEATTLTIFASLLAQLSIFALLAWRFTDQLRQLGASTSQRLLTAPPTQRLPHAD